MQNTHTLAEIYGTFRLLKQSIKDGEPGRGADIHLLRDIDLSLRQALVIAWLQEHKDSIFTTAQMGNELGMDEDTAQAVIDSLLEMKFLIREGQDIDVDDAIEFRILDIQAMKATGMITSWREYDGYGKTKKVENDDEEDDDASDEHFFKVPSLVSDLYGNPIEENEFDDSSDFNLENESEELEFPEDDDNPI